VGTGVDVGITVGAGTRVGVATGIAVGVGAGVRVVVGDGVRVGGGARVGVSLAVAVGAGVNARGLDGSGVSAGRVVASEVDVGAGVKVEVGTDVPVGVPVGEIVIESVDAGGGLVVDSVWQATNTSAPMVTTRAQYRLLTIQIFSMKQEFKTRPHARATGRRSIPANPKPCSYSVTVSPLPFLAPRTATQTALKSTFRGRRPPRGLYCGLPGAGDMMSKNTDVIVVGGGVIGCSIAYQLAKQGMSATVLERGQFGSGASGATAGVIGPLWHVDPNHKAVFDLGMRSLELFPGLASELAEAGVNPEFQHRGILKVAFNPAQVDELKQNLTWQGELGLGVRWLDAPEIRELEPELDDGLLGGVFSPGEGCISGQRLVDALVNAATGLGAVFLEETEVIGLETSGHTVVGVRTLTDSYQCGHTVLAAGPWTGIPERWSPLPIGCHPPEALRIPRNSESDTWVESRICEA